MPEAKRDYDRVELVWPGKRTEVERVRLPFQTIERVNDVRRSREGQAPLVNPQADVNGWRNRLVWGDNEYILSSLLDGFRGAIDLIYIDPPFATGDDFTNPILVGAEDGMEVTKEPSVIEETAYRDTWRLGIESYIDMMRTRLVLMHELMAPDSTIWVHMDEHAGHYVRVLLDEIFGSAHFVNEIVWYYPDNFQGNVNRYANNHNVIFVYGKGDGVHVQRQKTERPKPTKINRRKWDPVAGKLVSERDEAGNIIYDSYSDKWLDDVWVIGQKSVGQSRSWEYLPYPTQKPEEILQNVILSGTSKGDLVADFFCGSGTTLAVAEKLGRRWLGSDLSRYAVHTTRKRLQDIPGCRPFEVQNLGRYERKHWQAGRAGEAIGEYYSFILDLYGARSFPGFVQLHGEKAGRMVHVGATDAPVTAAELRLAIEECVDNGFSTLDVLGWEWEMGLNPAGKEELERHYGVSARLYNIPREVMDRRAVDAGDVRFFELSVAEVEDHVDGRDVTLELRDFLPALDEYMREKVAGKISKWSDWIDYWSVDYEFDGETFVNQWQAYRTRRNPKLTLCSDPHVYADSGNYTVVVKVIDIFGNDTTREIAVEIT